MQILSQNVLVLFLYIMEWRSSKIKNLALTMHLFCVFVFICTCIFNNIEKDLYCICIKVYYELGVARCSVVFLSLNCVFVFVFAFAYTYYIMGWGRLGDKKALPPTPLLWPV